MNVKALLVTLMLEIVPVLCAQSPQTPTARPGCPNPARAEHQQEMMEMHKQQMEAMRADVAKMKASLAEMKANLLTIKDTNEMARWRNNVELWETMVGHLEQMQKQMESMGQGSMGPMHHSMEGQPPAPHHAKPE